MNITNYGSVLYIKHDSWANETFGHSGTRFSLLMAGFNPMAQQVKFVAKNVE